MPKLVAFENLFAKLEALWWLPFSRSELEMFCIEIERPEAASEARRGAALPIRLQNQLLIKKYFNRASADNSLSSLKVESLKT